MDFKKQYFDNQELALFFQAFGKRLFTRPKNNEIFSKSESDGCTFYFALGFYDVLLAELNNANNLGKFDESNAASDWKNLLAKVMNATNESLDNIENLNDYFIKVGTYWG